MVNLAVFHYPIIAANIKFVLSRYRFTKLGDLEYWFKKSYNTFMELDNQNKRLFKVRISELKTEINKWDTEKKGDLKLVHEVSPSMNFTIREEIRKLFADSPSKGGLGFNLPLKKGFNG